MKIKETDLILQFVGQRIKFFGRHQPLCPVRFRTEQAIQIAHIRYFKIASGNHIVSIKAYKDKRFIRKTRLSTYIYIYMRICF